MVGPSGGAQAPARTAAAPRTTGGGPGRQVSAARAHSRAPYSDAIGIRARRGPCRSTRAARSGIRKTAAAPNRAITVPETAYEPVARETDSSTDSVTVPYESRAVRAAAKVRRACGTRRTAAYEGRGAWEERDEACADMAEFLDSRRKRGHRSAATAGSRSAAAGCGRG